MGWDSEGETRNRADGGSTMGLGLRGKLVLSLLPMVLAAFAVTWYVAKTAARSGLEAASIGGLTTEAKGLAAAVSSTFDDSLSDAQMLARLDMSAATIENKDPKAFRWFADQMVTSKKRYAALILADNTGKILATNTIGAGNKTLPSIDGQSIDGEAWAMTKKKGKGQDLVLIPAGRPAFVAAWLPQDNAAGFHLQVKDVMGDPIGTLTMLLSLDSVASSLSTAVSAEGGQLRSMAMVVDGAGQPLMVPANVPDRATWQAQRFSKDVAGGAHAWTAPNGGRFLVADENLGGVVSGWGWRLAGLKAIEIVDAPVAALSQRLSVVFGICALALIALVVFLAGRIVAPIRRLLAAATGSENNGRLTTTTVESNDEVGVLTRAFNDMVRALNTDLAKHMKSISGSSAELLSSANQLNHTSAEMTQSSRQTSTFAGTARTSIEDFVASMKTVSEGTSALTTSISYVAEHAHGARSAVEGAVRAATNAGEVMTQLHARSQEIEEVLKVIGSVANQTKLLALNATIEATRAGEFGRGFGVVAQEVKDLARRVSKSTDDIARRIDAMRVDTGRAMDAVKGFQTVIEKVNDISQSLSSTAEQQLATTREIHRHVEGAAGSATAAQENIASLVHSAEDTNRGANDTGRAADSLLRMASDLQGLTTAMRLAPQDEPPALNGHGSESASVSAGLH